MNANQKEKWKSGDLRATSSTLRSLDQLPRQKSIELNNSQGKMDFGGEFLAQRRRSTPMSVESLLRYYERNSILKRNELGGSFSSLLPTQEKYQLKNDVENVSKFQSNSQAILGEIASRKIFPITKKFIRKDDKIDASASALKSISGLQAEGSLKKPEADGHGSILPSRGLKTARLKTASVLSNKSEVKTPGKNLSRPSFFGGKLVVTCLEELKDMEKAGKSEKSDIYHAVTAISVYDIDFDELSPFLAAINGECKKLQTLELHRTGIKTFQHLEQLVQLRTLENLLIEPTGNPITQCSTWTLYLTRRMSHLALKTINGERITSEMCCTAQQVFGATVQLLRTRQQHLQEMEEGTSGEEDCQKTPWPLIPNLEKVTSPIKEISNQLSHDIMDKSLSLHVKNNLFHHLFRQSFTEAIKLAITENKHLNLLQFQTSKNHPPTSDSES